MGELEAAPWQAEGRSLWWQTGGSSGSGRGHPRSSWWNKGHWRRGKFSCSRCPRTSHEGNFAGYAMALRDGSTLDPSSPYYCSASGGQQGYGVSGSGYSGGNRYSYGLGNGSRGGHGGSKKGRGVAREGQGSYGAGHATYSRGQGQSIGDQGASGTIGEGQGSYGAGHATYSRGQGQGNGGQGGSGTSGEGQSSYGAGHAWYSSRKGQDYGRKEVSSRSGEEQAKYGSGHAVYGRGMQEGDSNYVKGLAEELPGNIPSGDRFNVYTGLPDIVGAVLWSETASEDSLPATLDEPLQSQAFVETLSKTDSTARNKRQSDLGLNCGSDRSESDYTPSPPPHHLCPLHTKGQLARAAYAALKEAGYTTTAKYMERTGVLLKLEAPGTFLAPSNGAWESGRLPDSVYLMLHSTDEATRKSTIKRLMKYQQLIYFRTFQKLVKEAGTFYRTYTAETSYVKSLSRCINNRQFVGFRSVPRHGTRTAVVMQPNVYCSTLVIIHGTNNVLIPPGQFPPVSPNPPAHGLPPSPPPLPSPPLPPPSSRPPLPTPPRPLGEAPSGAAPTFENPPTLAPVASAPSNAPAATGPAAFPFEAPSLVPSLLPSQTPPQGFPLTTDIPSEAPLLAPSGASSQTPTGEAPSLGRPPEVPLTGAPEGLVPSPFTQLS